MCISHVNAIADVPSFGCGKAVCDVGTAVRVDVNNRWGYLGKDSRVSINAPHKTGQHTRPSLWMKNTLVTYRMCADAHNASTLSSRPSGNFCNENHCRSSLSSLMTASDPSGTTARYWQSR